LEALEDDDLQRGTHICQQGCIPNNVAPALVEIETYVSDRLGPDRFGSSLLLQGQIVQALLQQAVFPGLSTDVLQYHPIPSGCGEHMNVRKQVGSQFNTRTVERRIGPRKQPYQHVDLLLYWRAYTETCEAIDRE
jgi:hypothetical protein